MTPQEVTIGTRFELEVFDKNGEKVGQTYVSQLLEIQGDGSFVISAPIHEARLVFIPRGTQLHLTFVHRRLGLLGFPVLTAAMEYRGNVAVLIVKAIGKLESVQRRMNYRLETVLEAYITPVDDADAEPLAVYSKNISGSGLCLISEKSFPLHSEVLVELTLASDLSISAKCAILRSSTTQLKKGTGYELGMAFTDISKKCQDILIKYIFDQQRLQIKREK